MSSSGVTDELAATGMSAPLLLFSRHYDRVSAVADGRILLRGQRARCEVMPSIPETFQRMMADPQVLAGEMSFGFQAVVASQQARARFLGIPVFLSRAFRHGNVFVRADSSLHDFGDLRGKRVALEEYAMTMGIWVRGLMKDAGVGPEEICWVGAKDPVVGPEIAESLSRRVKLERSSGDALWSLLLRGEVDAVIGRPPTNRSLDDGTVRRLLANHWDRQRRYFRDTGIFPTMHLLVLRRDVYDQDPQMALDLYAAFDDARGRAVEDLRTNLNALAVTLPMLEEHVEHTLQVFGEDWWPYGISRNRPAIETFLAYCFEQGLTRAPVRLEQTFCPNTLVL
jgi:4,5-dihydroxyphthalate decarboxylase